MGSSVSTINDTPSVGGYKLYRTLAGHTRAINCIRFSPDGSLLASGGDDGCIRIWSLRSDGTCVQVLKCTRNGSVTDLRWRLDGSGLDLIFGCADGTVHFYHRSAEMGADFKPSMILEAHSRAIEALDYDPTHHRLATAAGGSIKVWGPEKKDSFGMRMLGMAPSEGHISRNIHFTTNGKQVVAAYLDSHKVVAWSIEPWSIVWQGSTFTRIGNSALSQDGEHLLVDNLSTGVDAYSIPNMVRKATYQTAASRRLPTQVVFGARGSNVVYGGDSGAIHVFDFWSAEIVQTLHHHPSSTGLVQSVTTYTGSDMHFIASGLSDEDFSVKVWAKKRRTRIQDSETAVNTTRYLWLSFAVWAFIIGFFVIPISVIRDTTHLLPTSVFD